ncbi:hypothetical protein CP97_14918 (plasmid) [Aurantiacibacter atlanticus]|uniref:Protein-L-isoaspartate O-methyltransferase n=1 Tax=Aurantiacibacter atlanticus TaxID=1648404 RepID=A0A168M4V1_9SPHN|nr:protein-L-isoaspartate(D-aspartate) O-methyltransferase [Aurantiacibacter atlanticus]ANC50607.1 hypothetical protein CP97_14918 [Aurantiacibacter atlanticus]
MEATFEAARKRMVEEQILRRGIGAERVLAAFVEVPRELFVSADLRENAYEDRALPIASGQTISQPYVVAAMIDTADIGPGDTVLEVGAGSGYAAAVISRIAARVIAIECEASLVAMAKERLAGLGYTNVEISCGDGRLGSPRDAPFDSILVSAAAPAVPEALKQQLVIGGRLVMPVGDIASQTMVLIVRCATDQFIQTRLGPVRFVPLLQRESGAQTSA